MKLTMLHKDPASDTGSCPSIYVAENGDFVVQGYCLDADTQANLCDVLPGESAVRISAEILLDAVKMYNARPRSG